MFAQVINKYIVDVGLIVVWRSLYSFMALHEMDLIFRMVKSFYVKNQFFAHGNDLAVVPL